jgi:hypothetical protein
MEDEKEGVAEPVCSTYQIPNLPIPQTCLREGESTDIVNLTILERRGGSQRLHQHRRCGRRGQHTPSRPACAVRATPLDDLMRSSRGDLRRADLGSCPCEEQGRSHEIDQDVAISCGLGIWRPFPPCHCEERSDVAISCGLGIWRPFPPCHCEERSDVAISTVGLLRRRYPVAMARSQVSNS